MLFYKLCIETSPTEILKILKSNNYKIMNIDEQKDYPDYLGNKQHKIIFDISFDEQSYSVSVIQYDCWHDAWKEKKEVKRLNNNWGGNMMFAVQYGNVLLEIFPTDNEISKSDKEYFNEMIVLLVKYY